MNVTIPGTRPGRKGLAHLYVGPLIVFVVFVLTGVVSYLNTDILRRDASAIMHTHEVLATLDEIVSLMKDAETGQRGFIITGQEKYLEPYNNAVSAIPSRFRELESHLSYYPEQLSRIPELRTNVDAKLSELAETIQLRRTQGVEAARGIVLTDRGKLIMDQVRARTDQIEADVVQQRRFQIVEMNSAFKWAVASALFMGLIGAALTSLIGFLMRRAELARRYQEWIQAGQLGISQELTGDKQLEQLGEGVLGYLAKYLEAQAGAFFVRDGNYYKRVATYGVPPNSETPERFSLNDGLLGQAVKDQRAIYLHNVPDNYLSFGSAFGKSKPRHLAVLPTAGEGIANAVMELGFIKPFHFSVTEFLQQIAQPIGSAVRAANYRDNLQKLLEETQRQAEELQTQGEELRVSNEELEEQGKALRESQARLELQQTELEQTNAQLEETAQTLETERDNVTRSKDELERQAAELEKATRYKSDFLANMSHELRTPLNSSLILAKLLSDNPSGNLSEEQVKYAQTIEAAGNDLLSLINDILDLSKIEAGHMQVTPEVAEMTRVIEELERIFTPIAHQKGLVFRTHISPGVAATIFVDIQRLQQILKNLLSNAFKFTEKGEVALEISPLPAGRISFAVRDSGIGIPESQQQIVFEAFRQADGTTNRKYGGTGLGLSIARELARLLGGSIHLVSTPGSGSTFTLTLPEKFDPSFVPNGDSYRLTDSRSKVTEEQKPSGQEKPLPRKLVRRLDDDRERLSGNRRVILAIEDDEPFAKIIYELAHELGFHCLLATSAEEGIAVAVQHRPSAIVLDISLPDHSGLSVLDRLKHDSRTRHIPVHVVSAFDYADTALALGAVGYMLKPVKRDELTHAFKALETKLEQRMRSVLIVEDDPVQLESLGKLLGLHAVRTEGVGSAAECLEKLRSQTYDCMVLDLSLPDASGYFILETLSKEDTYSFPPVIVYTGRELSMDEEDRLRKYSKSIIIKGAKSPERLLDEVTLFLHQVVSELPAEQQRMIERARSRDAALEGKRILIAEDDVRNIFAVTSILEPRGAVVQVARNGREALDALSRAGTSDGSVIDLVLMDVMMPEMDGLTAMREIRKQKQWAKLPIIALTAKAMKNDQEECLAAGASDYMSKPLDVEKLLSLIRVWIRK